MGGHREGFRGDGGMNAAGQPLRILMSQAAAREHAAAVAECMAGRPHLLVSEGDADIAFVSRDVTGLSTKHQLEPATRAFHDTLLAAPSLRWVQIHSAGADRPVYLQLHERGVTVTTASGANADVVAQTVVAGLLALARRFPQLMAAQREKRWASLMGGALPRDLSGQQATIVGWGPIGQHVGRLVEAFGLKVAVVRSAASAPGVVPRALAFEQLHQLLPTTDWLVLACPLSDRTRGLVGAEALALLPPGAHLLNVARGEVVDETALVEALRDGRLGGAFLDVFRHEPLPQESPLWSMPNVIATPHSAGISDGNADRVADIFLANLRRRLAGEPLVNAVG